MTPQQIVDKLRQKDWSLIEQQRIGPEAAPEIAKLLKDSDTEVREITLHALDQAGGTTARQGLLRALDDSEDMVRATAARLLHNRYTAEELPVLLKQIAENEDEYVREQAALIVGKIGDASAIAPLERQAAIERDGHAKQAMSLALARLGDRAHLTEYVNRLRRDDPKARASALHELDYLNERRLVRFVLPLLDDKRDAENVGPSHAHYWIRVCDVAINALDALLRHPFPFAVTPFQRYSDQQLQQAKAVLATVR
jgi:HEAT repeat protein